MFLSHVVDSTGWWWTVSFCHNPMLDAMVTNFGVRCWFCGGILDHIILLQSHTPCPVSDVTVTLLTQDVFEVCSWFCEWILDHIVCHAITISCLMKLLLSIDPRCFWSVFLILQRAFWTILHFHNLLSDVIVTVLTQDVSEVCKWLQSQTVHSYCGLYDLIIISCLK